VKDSVPALHNGQLKVSQLQPKNRLQAGFKRFKKELSAATLAVAPRTSVKNKTVGQV